MVILTFYVIKLTCMHQKKVSNRLSKHTFQFLILPLSRIIGEPGYWQLAAGCFYDFHIILRNCTYTATHLGLLCMCKFGTSNLFKKLSLASIFLRSCNQLPASRGEFATYVCRTPYHSYFVTSCSQCNVI